MELSQVQVHGFISQGYMKTTDNNFLTMMTKDGSFEFNEAAVNFSFKLGAKLKGGVQLFSKDLGREGNHNIILDWGYGDYRWKDWLGFRLGRIKTPRGFYNETRDIDALRSTVLLPQSVYDEGMKDPAFAYQGAGIYGFLPLNGGGDLEYEFFGGTFNVYDSRSGFWDNNFKFLIDGFTREMPFPAPPVITVREPFIRGNYIYGSALKWNTPLEGLRVGGSILYAGLDMQSDVEVLIPTELITIIQLVPINLEVEVQDHIVYSAEYKYENLTLAWEKHTNKYIVREPSFQTNRDYETGGWYAQLTYQLTDWLTVSSYYSDSRDEKKYQPPEKPDHDYWLIDECLALAFNLTPNWLVKLEGHYMDGTYTLGIRENPEMVQYWSMFAVKTSFHF